MLKLRGQHVRMHERRRTEPKRAGRRRILLTPAVLSSMAVLLSAALLLLRPASASPNDTMADHVVGQPNFESGVATIGCNQGVPSYPTSSTICLPDGVVDSAVDLYVVDRQNNRVLVYDSPLRG